MYRRTFRILFGLIFLGIILYVVLTQEPPITAKLSPSATYGLVASVDEDHIIYLDLYNESDDHLDSVRTGASLYTKWSFGWLENSDVAVLYSADIGTRAYTASRGKLIPITQPDTSIHDRAATLYYEQYGQLPDSGATGAD